MDTYANIVNTQVGRILARRVGLPLPERLERYQPGPPSRPVIDGPVLLGAAPGGKLVKPIAEILARIGAQTADLAPSDQTFKALVFDATGIAASEQLGAAYEFFHPAIRRLRPCGRVVVLGSPPASIREPRKALAQRALEGLVRSIGKEVRHGATAQFVQVAPRAGGQLESTLRFLLSPRSAFVSGQVIRISAATHATEQPDWQHPLAGKVALVTGAGRGIGRSIAGVLTRDGAHVVAVDLPAQATELAGTLAATGGSALELDITAQDAPARLAAHLSERHGGVDIVVHNAGITRDRRLARMTREQWDRVIAVNLTAQERIDRELFAQGTVREHGRVVTVSSISGLAGNAGQANYATSKAGVIGIVEAFAPILFKRGHTLNAVAPGFIETDMTAAMPIALREAGRRLNSLSQGGLPVDVAETVAWLASPASAGVNGNVVRVCGQSLIGA
jgi:3-oxoacyl-[acyl-carrier protein] reductase